MTLNKALQKPEESVRRPQTLDDSVLIGLADNGLRKVLAEVSSVTLVDTLNAIVSQIRQILHGTAVGNWSDLPAATLDQLAPLLQTAQIFLVNPGQTVVLASTPLTSLRSKSYHFEIANPAGDFTGSFEMQASRQGPDVTDSIHSIIGFRFSTTVNFAVSGADAVLAVTNNEAYALSVKLTKRSD